MAGDWVGDKLANALGLDDKKIDTVTKPVTGEFASIKRDAPVGDTTINKNVTGGTTNAPMTVVQNFYGVTDKNFVVYVKSALVEIERRRSQ